VSAVATRSTRLVRAWVGLYTGALPAESGERRRLELESDMWEQLHDPAETRPGRALMGRWVRGVPSDLWWRYRTLLDHRASRPRDADMSLSRNWWVVLTALYGVGMIVLSIGAAVFPRGDAVIGPAIAAATGAVAGGIVLGGLVVRQKNVMTGSWLVVAGCLMPLDLILLPLSALVVISGLWTANVQLSGLAGEPTLRVASRQQAAMTRWWYLWFVVAAVLFVIGFGALMVLGDGKTATGEDDLSLSSGLAWFAWILSWLGAIVSAGLGVVLGTLRGVLRHRTRLAGQW
jgi:hypothetical protein